MTITINGTLTLQQAFSCFALLVAFATIIFILGMKISCIRDDKRKKDQKRKELEERRIQRVKDLEVRNKELDQVEEDLHRYQIQKELEEYLAGPDAEEDEKKIS